jgi:hypothetical protein
MNVIVSPNFFSAFCIIITLLAAPLLGLSSLNHQRKSLLKLSIKGYFNSIVSTWFDAYCPNRTLSLITARILGFLACATMYSFYKIDCCFVGRDAIWSREDSEDWAERYENWKTA